MTSPETVQVSSCCDQAVPDDCAALVDLLHDVLREQGGEPLLQQIAALRRQATAHHRGDAESDEVAATVVALPSDAAVPIIRACSMHLAMANLADQSRHFEHQPDLGPRGSDLPQVPPAAARLQSGAGAPQLDIRLVLTAHPTDIARRSVLSKHRVVATCLQQLHDPRLRHFERRRVEDDIREALSIWYATNEVRSMRPRVSDEVRRVLFVFESVLYDSVPQLAHEHGWVLADEPAVRPQTPPLRFGSWAGGDMDGNPHVGPTTILETLKAHRILALELLIDRLVPLRQQFSQGEGSLDVSEALRDSLARDARELPETAASLATRYPHEAREPLRRKLAFIIARLRHTLAMTRGGLSTEPGYRAARELTSDLEAVHASVGSQAVMHGRLERLMWQVLTFGFHLATLEVRSNAPELQEACALLLPGYSAARTETERTALLTRACVRETLPDRDEGQHPKAAGAFDAVARAIEAYGSDALDTFILSNAAEPSDVLCALWLARRSGLFQPPSGPPPGYGGVSKIELVPLFERRIALERATKTMGQLYGNAAYIEHLRARGHRQEVMLGYSDAGKDMGYLASQWTLYQSQEGLARQANTRGIELRLFHGRGGSTSRGGGPAYQSILAQPPGTVSGRIKITEQGEVISAKFSNERLAVHALQQTVAAVIHVTVEPGTDPHPRWYEEMGRMGTVARDAYQHLVYEDADLVTVFSQCTPIDVLGELNIGSRPTSRGSRGAVQSLRAIPWVFAWMQSRIGLPSWYGAGAGLAAGDLETQREMYEQWPLFNHLVTGLETALVASDLIIGKRYIGLADAAEPAQRVWTLVETEHERCERRVLAITRRDRLLSPSPGAIERHQWRRTWLDVLAYLQIELLRRHRAGDANALEPLLATIAGIATGLRTTG